MRNPQIFHHAENLTVDLSHREKYRARGTRALASRPDKIAGKPGTLWSVDINLRLAGLVLAGVAAAAILCLSRHVQSGGHHAGTMLEYCLALIGFTCASIGSAMLILGSHLLDKVQVSERWRVRP